MLNDAAGELERAPKSASVANIVVYSLKGTAPQRARFDQTLLGERGDVVAVLRRKADHFAD
jgi:hypothetical protein